MMDGGEGLVGVWWARGSQVFESELGMGFKPLGKFYWF